MKLLNRILILSCAAMAMSGCISQTIRPTAVKVEQASFDGVKQDSGLIEITPAGAVVTSHFRERYNALIERYGKEKEFSPSLFADQEMNPAPAEVLSKYPDRGRLYVLSNQALVRFLKMNRWKKMGRTPATEAAQPGVVSRVVDAVLK